MYCIIATIQYCHLESRLSVTRKNLSSADLNHAKVSCFGLLANFTANFHAQPNSLGKNRKTY